MQAVRKINNNAAICVDGKGRELVALGKGIGFGQLPREVGLAEINRTFYGVDEKYLSLIGEMPEDVLEFAGQLADVCRATLSYELSPNLPITLADHIAFMIKRAREHMVVQMPLAYDVQQAHPAEYRLGEMAVRGARKTFGVRIDRHEAVGIALSIVNSALTQSERTARKERDTAVLLEAITRIVEEELGITVDRNSFDYARFATHVQYLIDRVIAGEPIATQNEQLYDEVVAGYPEAAHCARKASALIEGRLGGELTKEEQLYLMLHVNRISERIAKKFLTA
ncbi:MAG: PRD domain-containing protein [Atopobiaceae bacterium]|nr:PRD domain-containing protein [Atopobiaceae bacterium]